jgi:hypothetical protein
MRLDVLIARFRMTNCLMLAQDDSPLYGSTALEDDDADA